MPAVNKDILSEIEFSSNVSDDMKAFLKWLVEFERENMDRDLFAFKKDIEAQVKKILGG